MKPLSNIGYCRVLVLAVLTIISCTKNNLLEDRNGTTTPLKSAASKPFKLSGSGLYKIAPSATSYTFLLNGAAYTTGHFAVAQLNATASGFGNAKLFLNHQMYYSSAGSAAHPAGVLPASVANIANYPVQTQDPSGVSEIRQDDMDVFSSMNNRVNPPATVKGFKVNAVLYGGGADAVYLALEPFAPCTGAGTQLLVYGQAYIVGGAGRYLNAYGRVDIEAAMNPGTREMNFSANGWISN